MSVSPGLRPTIVIVDYQNMHLSGVEAFLPRDTPVHEGLLDPLRFARTLVAERNRSIAEFHPAERLARLSKVLVYRGLPSAEYEPRANARNQRQQAAWESRAGDLVAVHNQPLSYELHTTGFTVDYSGRRHRQVEASNPREKGVDVLCAVQAVLAAQRLRSGLVIVASHDKDLEPAIDAARAQRGAKVEGVRWAGRNRLVSATAGYWTTTLTADHFTSSVDPDWKNYY